MIHKMCWRNYSHEFDSRISCSSSKMNVPFKYMGVIWRPNWFTSALFQGKTLLIENQLFYLNFAINLELFISYDPHIELFKKFKGFYKNIMCTRSVLFLFLDKTPQGKIIDNLINFTSILGLRIGLEDSF